MTLLRPIAAAVLLICSLAFASCASTPTGAAKTGTTDGTFVRIDQGDYAHFLIKETNGKDASFIVLRPDASVQQYLDKPAKLKGHKVRVHWQEQTIPEAGGLMKTVVKVE